MIKKIKLKKFIKAPICIGLIFLLESFWLVSIIVDAPIDPIKAEAIPIIFKFSKEGPKNKNNPNLNTFVIFHLLIDSVSSRFSVPQLLKIWS